MKVKKIHCTIPEINLSKVSGKKIVSETLSQQYSYNEWSKIFKTSLFLFSKKILLCLFDLILYIPSTIFQL